MKYFEVLLLDDRISLLYQVPITSELQDMSLTTTALCTIRCMKLGYTYKPFSPFYNRISLTTVEDTHITFLTTTMSLQDCHLQSCHGGLASGGTVFNKARNMLPAIMWLKFICNHRSNSTRAFSYVWCWLLHKSQLTQNFKTYHCTKVTQI
jgi:hypothetical protein